MTEYSIGDVADRAGVANDDVVMLVELGILSSGPDGHFSEGDARRIRLVQRGPSQGSDRSKVGGRPHPQIELIAV